MCKTLQLTVEANARGKDVLVPRRQERIRAKMLVPPEDIVAHSREVLAALLVLARVVAA